MSDLLKFSVPGDPKYVQIAKTAAQSAAGLADYTMEAVEDIGIAVGEACKLITCHGFDGWSNSYDIECVIDNSHMQITISDEHCRHEIKKDKRPCMDCPNEGNLGMLVIKSLMDEVEIINEEGREKSIRMVKHK